MATAKHDENQVEAATAASNADGSTPVRLYADPSTHVLAVSDNTAIPDPAKWGSFNAGQLSGVAGQLKELSILGGNYAGVYTLITYDLTGTSFQTKVTSAGDQTITSFEVYPVLLELDGNNRVWWYISQGNIKAYKLVGGVQTQIASATYSAATMVYFRLRESAGTLFWDYSANNSTWTNLTTLANPFAITALRYYIQIGTWQAEVSTSFALFDDATTGSTVIDNFGGTDYGTLPAKRDTNGVPVIMGVSNSDGSTPVELYADPATGQLLIDST